MRNRQLPAWLLVGTHGGPTRARILDALRRNGPMNANQLADTLQLDYTTVRYHTGRLLAHQSLVQSGPKYGNEDALSPVLIWSTSTS